LRAVLGLNPVPSSESATKQDWSFDDFPFKSPRKETASVLISIKTRELLREWLWSDNSIRQGGYWIMLYESQTKTEQQRLYNAVRSIQKKHHDESASIRFCDN